jgi:hypothetical protein
MEMENLEQKILKFTHSVRKALDDKNWYAALALSLSLPDICGKLQHEHLSSTKRYIQWFNDYLREKYTSRIGAEKIEHVFLNGEDTYALRCAYLHSGEVGIEQQWVKKVLSKFIFIAPKNGSVIHGNQFNDVLQLQVDIFCKDICDAVELWVQDFKNDEKIQLKAETIIDIHTISDGFSF